MFNYQKILYVWSPAWKRNHTLTAIAPHRATERKIFCPPRSPNADMGNRKSVVPTKNAAKSNMPATGPDP
jgi:hypothetical protein